MINLLLNVLRISFFLFLAVNVLPAEETDKTDNNRHNIVIICDTELTGNGKLPPKEKHDEAVRQTAALNDKLCSIIRLACFKSRLFDLVDRKNIDYLLEEKGIVASGLANNPKYREIAKLAGADAILLCNLKFDIINPGGTASSQFGTTTIGAYAKTMHEIKMIDVDTGKILCLSIIEKHIKKETGLRGLDPDFFRQGMQSINDLLLECYNNMPDN
ncbi:CsgG/HfaB family protein [Desulfosarcina ovata]|uniref:Uncharacterized protein n=1 Tax=Desulfosarcina ovata subsp. ovata TaxID=2752305 RepID=A0A5K8A9Q4_9BACT|nr:CsgG/HfaB family protein [Desulfosarcina ovata]BBO89305.1 hypothetical protein DSCOOX_24850 [Desulfosarcina ovata subsp. ovata]